MSVPMSSVIIGDIFGSQVWVMIKSKYTNSALASPYKHCLLSSKIDSKKRITPTSQVSCMDSGPRGFCGRLVESKVAARAEVEIGAEVEHAGGQSDPM